MANFRETDKTNTMKLLTISKYLILNPLGLALFAIAAYFPLASSGQTVIASLPYVITAPGVYVLNSSLHYFGSSQNAPAITVSVGNVTIDLQGNFISNIQTGPPVTIGTAVGIGWVNVPNVTVRNGSIFGFVQGIRADNGGSFNLTGILIENVRFTYNTQNAIYLISARNATVRNCQISSTGFDSANAKIPGSNGVAIADVNGAGGGNLFVGNNITEASATGILLGSNDLAADNFITLTPIGIQSTDSSSKLKGNTVSQCPNPYSKGTQLPGTNF